MARWTGGSVLLAEVGTIQLEFQSLSDRINDNKYGTKVSDVFIKLDPQSGNVNPPIRGQYPIFLDTNSVRFRNSHVTWGAMGDSFYEYLLKYWIYTGKKKDSRYRRMYVDSVEGMIEHLLKTNGPSGRVYIAEWKNGRLDHKYVFIVSSNYDSRTLNSTFSQQLTVDIWLDLKVILYNTLY